MKKALIAIIFLFITFLIIFLIVSLSPKKINIATTGMKYNRDDIHLQYGEPVKVKITGEVIKKRRTDHQGKFIGYKRNFIGYIEIEGETIPVREESKLLNIGLFDDHWGLITYTQFNSYAVPRDFYDVGYIFTDKNFKHVAFILNTDYDFNLPWKSLVVLPSKNREDTLNIINELNNPFFDNQMTYRERTKTNP